MVDKHSEIIINPPMDIEDLEIRGNLIDFIFQFPDLNSANQKLETVYNSLNNKEKYLIALLNKSGTLFEQLKSKTDRKDVIEVIISDTIKDIRLKIEKTKIEKIKQRKKEEEKKKEFILIEEEEDEDFDFFGDLVEEEEDSFEDLFNPQSEALTDDKPEEELTWEGGFQSYDEEGEDITPDFTEVIEVLDDSPISLGDIPCLTIPIKINNQVFRIYLIDNEDEETLSILDTKPHEFLFLWIFPDMKPVKNIQMLSKFLETYGMEEVTVPINYEEEDLIEYKLLKNLLMLETKM